MVVVILVFSGPEVMIIRKEREAGKDILIVNCVNAGQKQKACKAGEHKCIILTNLVFFLFFRL